MPVEVVRADHRAAKLCPGYPPYILVKFTDGSERKYKREYGILSVFGEAEATVIGIRRVSAEQTKGFFLAFTFFP